MRVIDDDTIAFRDGRNRVYVAHMQGSCNGLAERPITRSSRSSSAAADLCRGDIAQVVDTVQRHHGRQLRLRRLHALREPRAEPRLDAVKRVEPLAIDFRDDMAPDLHRRRQLLVLDREGLVGEHEAPHLLDHRQVAH